MKLLSIKTAKKTTGATVQNIQAPKLQGVKTMGYINLIGRNKVESDNGKVLIFEEKPIKKQPSISAKAFNQVLVQVGIFEAKIQRAKEALRTAKRMLLTSVEWFKLHVELAKSCLHLRTYRYSLPKGIVNLLF